MDEEDNILSEIDYVLSNATDISVENVSEMVEKYGGVCYPAHIDRVANGIVSVLGVFPENSNFSCYELHDKENRQEYENNFKHLKDKINLIGSDAHFLWDIRDKEAYIELDDEPYSSDLVRKRLFEYLRRKK